MYWYIYSQKIGFESENMAMYELKFFWETAVNKFLTKFKSLVQVIDEQFKLMCKVNSVYKVGNLFTFNKYKLLYTYCILIVLSAIYLITFFIRLSRTQTF